MRRFTRLVIRGAVLTAAALWNVPPLAAQFLPSAPPGAGAPAGSGEPTAARPSTREMEKRFRRGRELLHEANYIEGTHLLQSILDNDEDDFFHPDADNTRPERSLKFETQALLGELPAAGREVYEKQYGPAARRLLVEAIRSGDADQFALITRRFFHTQAGYEAAYRLAADQLDHGHPLTAALSFERLRSTPRADDQFEPLLSLKTALSWQRAGRDETALDVLMQLAKKYRQPSIMLGGRDVPFFRERAEALPWMAAALGVAPRSDAGAAARRWTMFRGDARRNGESTGGSPYLNRGWRASTIEGATASSEQDTVVASAFPERLRAGANPGSEPVAPRIPGLEPLVVDDLVIVRGIGDLRAYELATGKLAWAAGEKDQFLLELLRTGGGPQAQTSGTSLLSFLIAQRAWDDMTFGTISSDGEKVFAVEDLGLAGPSPVPTPRFNQNRDFNRLVAYDVRTGKAVWETGGPRGEGDEALSGAFCLGAPLVLDGRLYCLIEQGSEIRLVSLDPRDGQLLWSQILSDDAGGVWNFVRRRCGLTPSYDGGILVCPTGADQATAVDLTARSLLWRYRPRNRTDGYDPRPQQLILAPQQLAIRAQLAGGIDQNRWLDSAALISDARVLLTARDSNELHCLNLLDGTLLWKAPRGEGLFVAGVHEGQVLIVGRTFVQSLRLADGKPAWPEPATIPVPSGRGYLAGGRYHLPLSTAEVATIDLHDGRIVARSRSINERVPGNLIGVGGSVISQGADFVEAFQQLETLEAEIAATLAANPDSSEALALRGEIHLQRGDVRQAYADLQRALELKSDEAGVRELLVGSLLEGLRVDFAAYRHLEVDFDRLLITPPQRSAWLWLTASGLERSGEWPAAFETLLRFADPDVSDRETERVDAALTVRRDRLVKSRAARIFTEAAPADRAVMARAWQARADELLASGEVPAILRFLDYFGTLGDFRDLARRVAAAPDEGEWLAEEFRLRNLQESSDPQLAALATASIARILVTAERPGDAAPLLARIERQWPEVVSLGGKTGSELIADWKKRPEIARVLLPPPDWPAGVVESEREPTVGNPGGNRSQLIPLEGDRRPFFVDVTLEVSSRWQDFIARDATGRQIWKITFDAPIQTHYFMLNRAYARDHLLFVSVGTQLIAIDTLGTADRPGARILWQTNLIDLPPGQGAIVPLRQRNLRGRMPFNQMNADHLGMIGPVLRNYIAVQRGRKLQALDSLTGKPLWVRDGMAPGSELFGDEELLFVVPPDATSAEVYRALDGESLGTRALDPAPARLDAVDRSAVYWKLVDGRQVLSVCDVAAQRTLWQRDFAGNSAVAMIENDEVAVLEPGGDFTVLALADGAPVMKSKIEPENKLQQILVLRSRTHYVLICKEPTLVLGLQQNMPVDGNLHGFDRASGKKLWTTRVERQALDLNQPANLPVLTFAAQIIPAQRIAGKTPRFSLMCIDKRNGRVVFNEEQANEPLYYIDYAADVEQHQLELKTFRSTVRLTFTDKPWPE
jgi:outer membrane protein assembly factor BamB/tetratricopeptide (TPR) repeat protein